MLPGFKFRDKHCSELNIIMRSKKRPLLSAIKQQYESVPGQNGSYDFSDNTLDDGFVQLECVVKSESVTDLRSKARQIAAWLSGNGKLSFDDEPGLVYIGRMVNQIDITQVVTMGPFTLQFRCKPYAFDKESQQIFNITTAPETVALKIGGTTPTPPRILVVNKGAATIPSLSISTETEID